MPARNYDAYIWLGLGVCILVGVRFVGQELHEIVRLSKKPGAADDQAHAKQNQTTEDSIPLSVLETLAFCPSYDIREAAIKIISHRFRDTFRGKHFPSTKPADDSAPAAARDESEAAEYLIATLEHYGAPPQLSAPSSPTDTASALIEADMQEMRRRWRRREAIVVGTAGGDGADGVEEIVIREPVMADARDVDAGGRVQVSQAQVREALRAFEELGGGGLGQGGQLGVVVDGDIFQTPPEH